MRIYFRCCEKQQSISNAKRLSNLDITTITKKCWLSLQDSVSEEDSFVILHDEVSESTLDFINNSAKGLIAFVEVPKHDWDFHQHTITLFDEMEKDFKNSNPNDWYYIVENDYLHTKDALNIMRNAQLYYGGFIVSQDYLDRYTNPKPSYIMVGQDRHWRTIDSGTMTTSARVKTWEDSWDFIKSCGPTSDDKIFNTLYKHIGCISPIPGVSTHLIEHTMSPLVNWERRWNELSI